MRRGKYPVLWILSLLGFVLFAAVTVQEMASVGPASLTREDAGRLAADFLKEKGIETSGYVRTELYGGDTGMDAYLKRHKLQEEFERAAHGVRPLSYWEVTFFIPGADLYRVRLDESDGRVIGFELRRRVGPGLPAVGEEEALRLAREELVRQGVALSRLAPVKLGGKEREERREQEWHGDYKFVWQDLSWRVGDARYVYKVGITGNRVTAFQTEFLIPQADLDWLEKQQNLGLILTGISFLGMLLLVVFSFVVAIAYPRHQADWGRGLILGIVLLACTLVSNLNEWPVFLVNVGIADIPPEWMLWTTGLSVAAFSLLSAGGTYLTAVAGGILENELWPGKWLRREDGRWPQRVRAAAYRGYLLAFFWLGLQSAFYWVSERYFGVWQENDYSLTPWNYLVPGLFPLLAWMAGIGEEITFRLLGMGLVRRYLGSAFLALLLPAMIWALAHSLYPVHPFYTRFVELTLLGVVIGWCFLRYDLETVIFAHIVFDTVLMCVPLLFEGTWKEQVWAVGWLVLPALAGRYSHLLQPKSARRGGGVR